MSGTRSLDQTRFAACLARASVGQIPTADTATHERAAREAIAAHPDLVNHARETGNYLPLIRRARERSEATLSEFWLAQRIGQIVRGEADA